MVLHVLHRVIARVVARCYTTPALALAHDRPLPLTLPVTLPDLPAVIAACSVVLKAVRQAIQARKTLMVRYYTPSAHRITTRTIRPLELTSTGVRGWCELRQQERVFRFDRVLAVTTHHESG